MRWQSCLGNDRVHPTVHLVYTLATGTAIQSMVIYQRCRDSVKCFLPVFPDGPTWIEFLDLSGLESFILAVIPFAHVFGEDILRLLGEVISQEIESLFCSLTRRHKCDAKVLGVEDA